MITTLYYVFDDNNAHFARCGTPDTLVSKYVTQYILVPFKAFIRERILMHETTNSGNSQWCCKRSSEVCQGMVRAMVGRVKPGGGGRAIIVLLNL